ncbi:hypothetical protein ABB37_08886 [Leptomonas pyrrhocoris]|uniref:Uncharacterized protein n=1 Tax=Leptomonas pyrrhocoris TaxID=157538 RepID=A0A0M9FS02_LEPPY|nr:hypothetical protein ABB37_08886 [Leptomonas pyrrhocoris]KPA74880.1 hypothetical protein ABB37_08886 [Leptomonas pyrrhocoris]|eukprot:XP_015653319.1 hypothetical protein ABB37_08886 [Leptomonas pyrrhocoris]
MVTCWSSVTCSTAAREADFRAEDAQRTAEALISVKDAEADVRILNDNIAFLQKGTRLRAWARHRADGHAESAPR